MKSFFLACCVIICALVCVPSYGQCGGGLSLPGRPILRAGNAVRSVAAARPFRRIFRRNDRG